MEWVHWRGGKYVMGALDVKGYDMAHCCGVGQARAFPLVLADGDTGEVVGLEDSWLLPRERPPRPFICFCPRL